MSAITVADAARSTLPAHRALVARSLALLRDAAMLTPRWYVALSGGKDSTVTLDLARQVWPDVSAVWADDEWFLPETGAYIDRLRASGVDVHQVRRARTHASWFRCHTDREGEPGTRAYARGQGWTGCVLGVRADENAVRRLGLRARTPLHYVATNEQYQAYPLAWWTVEDVWAYIAGQTVDYNHAYDRLAAIGVPRGRQRIGPYAVEGVLGYGQLAILKRGWPQEWNRFAAVYPQAREYA